jgi:cytoskeletal protein CcmA (bactofilin family)
MNDISESAINIIAEGTRIEGKVILDKVSRLHGVLVGEVHASPGSTVILSETGVIEGNVFADTLMIDGFIRGDVVAKTKVVISSSGRVLGNIQSPSLSVDFGGYFEGRCAMENAPSA